MPEPLKNSFGPDIPVKIAAMIKAVHKKFDSKSFITDALDGYEELELMPRAKAIAQVLKIYLPQAYEKAIKVLIDSLPPVVEAGDWGAMNEAHAVNEDNGSMAAFIYMPHVSFVAMYGLDDFDVSMQAQYEITQRFTAEFSIRGFIERYPTKTLKLLKQWARDPSVHVRRLVSEGTRPRLPWAQRLPHFQKDPKPVLQLLKMLKDDPELYVRRSVANNLNDIGKDNPEALIDITQSWMKSATAERLWLVRHALRSLIKQGNQEALAVLGYTKASKISIVNESLKPKNVSIGGGLRVEFALRNDSSKKQKLLVDLCVHYVKANGKTSPKVFKLKELELSPGESAAFSKKISFKPMTTRKHYAGKHKIEVLLNGKQQDLAEFQVKK